jgi:hypothetical protein
MDRVQRILEGEDPRSVLEQKEPKGPRTRQEIEQLMVEALEGMAGIEAAEPIEPGSRSQVARVRINAPDAPDTWVLKCLWEKENGQLRFMLSSRTVNPEPSIITPENPSDREVIDTIRNKVSNVIHFSIEG